MAYNWSHKQGGMNYDGQESAFDGVMQAKLKIRQHCHHIWVNTNPPPLFAVLAFLHSYSLNCYILLQPYIQYCLHLVQPTSTLQCVTPVTHGGQLVGGNVTNSIPIFLHIV